MRYLLKQLENNAKAFDVDDEMLGEDSDDPFSETKSKNSTYLLNCNFSHNFHHF